MKSKLSTLFCLLILGACGPSDVWWYGDIELGDEYYYMVEPAFNAIQTLKTDDDGRSNGFVIKNIEYIGFNEDFILAVNKDSLHFQYWVIDKTRNSDLYQKAKRNQLVHEEVIGPMDSLEFASFKTQQKIEMKAKTYYRKKLNYE